MVSNEANADIWKKWKRIDRFVTWKNVWWKDVCECDKDSFIGVLHLAAFRMFGIQCIGGWFLILAGVVLFFLSLYGASSKYMPAALLYLGRISYGMYVFHITMFWLVYEIFKKELASFSTMIGLYKWRNNVGFIIAFLTTVIISLLSYRFFEKPFLQLKRKFTLIPSRD